MVSACAVVDPTKGTYSIPGLTHGGYQVRIIPTDPEYLSTDPVSVLLGFGDDATVNAVLDRLGRLTVTTLSPDLSTGALRPAAGTAIGLAARGEADPGLRVSGKTGRRRDIHCHRAARRVPADRIGIRRRRICGQPGGRTNQTLAATLVLTRPIGPVVGRVTTNLRRGDRPGQRRHRDHHRHDRVHRVHLGRRDRNRDHRRQRVFRRGPAGLDGPRRDLPHLDRLPVGRCLGCGRGADQREGLLAGARPVTIAVAEADTRTESYQASDVLVSDPPVDGVRSLATILVSSQPSKFGAHQMVASPSDAVIDVTTLVFEVTRQPAGAGAVTMSLASGGQLVFRDSSQPDAGLAVPGHYTMVAHNRGFADATFAVDCPLGKPCTLTQDGPGAVPDQLTLWQLPKITGQLSLSALPPGLSDTEAAARHRGHDVTPLTVPPGTERSR